ncbi:MAG: O-antigen ligase family protein [bacterium]
MNLGGLLFIISLYFFAFAWGRIRDAKHFLLFTGIVSVPFEFTYSFYTWQPHNGWTSGIEISLSEISFLLLALITFFKGNRSVHVSRRIVWAVVLFVVASGLSGINSEVRKLTACQMLLVAKLFGLYYFGFVYCLESRKDIQAVLKYLCVSMVLQGAFCLMLYLTGLNFNRVLNTGPSVRSLVTVGDEGGIVRAFGSFPQPNSLAAYLVPLILLQGAIYLGGIERSRFRLLGIVGGLFGLIASFSRAGWLGFVVCFPALLIGLGRFRFLKVLFLTVCVIAGVLAVAPLRERILGDDHNSAASRVPLMHLAMNMVRQHWAIGVGANTYAMAKYRYLDDSLDGVWLDQVHNTYLLVLAETGVLGLGAFLLFLTFFFKEVGPCIKQHGDPFIRYLGLGLRLGLVASMFHMLVDMFHSRALLSSMFLLCGLATAARRNLEAQSWTETEELHSEPEATGKKPSNAAIGTR